MPHTPLPFSQTALLLADQDHVAVATRALSPGAVLDLADTPLAGRGKLEVTQAVPMGHKLAVRDAAQGEQVRKYGQSIGLALHPIAAGQHVHSHNLGMDTAEREHEFGTDRIRPEAPADLPRTFLGYHRPDGRVATRNFIGVITSVNCSVSTAKMIADQFRGIGALDEYENIDGVMAITHQSGCGLVPDSEGGQMLLRTLRGYANHPNFGGLLVLGLGCEMIPVESLAGNLGLPTGTYVETMTIQDMGGIRATVRAGVERIRQMLPEVNKVQREPADVSHLTLGLNCGGSDGYSGITANPALGLASDMLVAAGGTSVLAETPEVYGAEHLLTRRAVSPEVGTRLLDRIEWWKNYTAAGAGTLDNNPSPGNKAGGLTTILEKSLGAVAKGGSAEMTAVYEYAEPITDTGFTFMDTPGYDPVSVTGLVAGGATVVCFTTGRGSVLGCKPTPSIKLATNTAMYERMHEDMDINCGGIVDGTTTLEQKGREIYEQIIAVASGQRTVSEELDLGQDEFIPWHVGAVT